MEIPRYPASRPLALTDKPFLDDLFARLQPRISEFTFANLYLFRHAHAYAVTMVGDAVVVTGSGYDGAPYVLPPLSGDVGTAISQLLAAGEALYGADDTFTARHLSDATLEIREDRDNFDYLYLRQELAELPGNRFHKKKNRISYFTTRHTFTIERYTQDDLADCLDLLDIWRQGHIPTGSASLEAEAEATTEALALAGELGLAGLLIRVEGVVKGFMLGERLNSTTSVCHFEKADPFMEGVVQLLDREYNRLLFADCTYVNREQDLGEPGLREAKLSYHPVELVKKYRAWRRVHPRVK